MRQRAATSGGGAERRQGDAVPRCRACGRLNAEVRRLRSVPGVGPLVLATLVGRLPELGRFDHRRLAALAGLAAHACSGLCGAHHVWGGRARVRRAPSLAAFVAGDGAPRFKVFRRRLQAVGKPLKVANTACVSWLLTILNAMVRPDQDYRKAGA